MAFFDETTGQYSAGDLPPNVAAAAPKPTGPKPMTDPVTGNPVPSFMNNPSIARMLAMQQAGGTGRYIPPGGGGLGSLPMMQMLAPYLSQQPGGGMSPLIAQMLPMLNQQRMQPGGPGMGGMMQGAMQGMGGAQQPPGTPPPPPGAIPPELIAAMLARGAR